MVIDQGTLLDRIDFNVEQTAVHLQDAVHELNEVQRMITELDKADVLLSVVELGFSPPLPFLFHATRVKSTRRKPGTGKSFFYSY